MAVFKKNTLYTSNKNIFKRVYSTIKQNNCNNLLHIVLYYCNDCDSTLLLYIFNVITIAGIKK